MSRNSGRANEILDSKKICRTCMLSIENESDLMPLSKEVKGFTDEEDKFRIIDELYSINVGMEEHELLPKRICKSCVDLLQSVHAFRLLVQTSQSTLKRRLGIVEKIENRKIKKECIKEECGSISSELNFVDISKYKIENVKEMDINDEDNASDLHNNDNEEFFNDDIQHESDTEKIFDCWYCEKSFKDVKDLQTHEKNHIEEKPIRCKICKRCWKSLYEYKIHMRSHQRLPKDIHLCERCGIVAKKNEALGHFKGNLCDKQKKRPKHKYNQRGSIQPEKNYICTVCEKRYLVPQGLELHMKLHDKSRRYRCNMCEFAYTRNDHLQRHINEAHLKIKSYYCHICSKTFPTLDEKNRHVETHGDVRYPCKYCDKKFTTKHSLNIHSRLHTGEKPIVCPVCGERFFNKSYLETHQVKHTREEIQYANDLIIENILGDYKEVDKTESDLKVELQD